MRKTKILLLFSITMMAFTKSYGQFEKDRNYKNWRIHHTQGIYKPATSTLEYGNYSINTRAMRGYKLGFEYYFRKTKKLQFFTGLNMHFIPLDNYSYEMPGIELGLEQETYFDYTFRQIRYRHNVLSMPIGVQYRKSYNDKINIFAKMGINLDFLQYGQYSTSNVKPYESKDVNQPFLRLI